MCSVGRVGGCVVWGGYVGVKCVEGGVQCGGRVGGCVVCGEGRWVCSVWGG